MYSTAFTAGYIVLLVFNYFTDGSGEFQFTKPIVPGIIVLIIIFLALKIDKSKSR